MLFFLDLALAPYLNPSFCLNALNSKNIYYVLFVGLFLDLVIAGTLGKITLIFLGLFLINKRIKNYYLKNTFNFVIFSILMYPFQFKIFLISFLYFFLLIILLKKHNI